MTSANAHFDRLDRDDDDEQTFQAMQAQLDAAAARLGYAKGAPQWRRADYLHAHGQLLARSRDPRAPLDHPLALRQPDLTLLGMAKRAAKAAGQTPTTEYDLLAFGSVGASHLAELWTAEANAISLARGSAALTDVLAVTAPLEAKNYQPLSLNVLELDEIPIADAREFREWVTARPRATSTTAQVESAPIRLRVSHQTVINDNRDLVNRSIASITIAASQAERAALARVLRDGDLFDDQNTTRGPLHLSTMDEAIVRLRTRPLNGAPCAAAPHVLLIPPGYESEARVMLRQLQVDGAPGIALSVCPALDETDGAYLLADPLTWPTIGRLTLRGAGGRSLTWSPGRPDEKDSSQDLVLECMHSFGIAPTGSRHGIVRLLPE